MKRTDLEQEVARAWGDWVSSMGEWHVFGGLTYDPAQYAARHPTRPGSMPGADVVRLHARQWIQEGQRRLGRDIEAGLIALEHHKSGWPHLHPLLRVAGGLQGNEFRVLGQTWFERHGYARLEQPADQDAVSVYASKYLVKELHQGDIVIWPQRGPLSAHQPALQVGDANRRRRRGR